MVAPLEGSALRVAVPLEGSIVSVQALLAALASPVAGLSVARCVCLSGPAEPKRQELSVPSRLEVPAGGRLEVLEEGAPSRAL